MKEHKTAWIFITLVAGLLLITGSVLAAWNVSDFAVNMVSMASYKNTIQENYERPQHVDPGQKVIKEVNIKNEGNTDTFVRVKVDQMFGNTDQNGTFIKDSSLDRNMILIHYNTDLWELRKDGYWYYRNVLKTGESTEKPLMDSFILSTDADNRYKNKEARIIVNMESIQAEGQAMKTLWGFNEKELGITYQPCVCEEVSKVVLGKDGTLKFEGTETDLFMNFKNLQPGCSRSQVIGIRNQWKSRIKMMLRAEKTVQEKMTEEEQKLLDELLTKYALITVKDGTKTLYQGTVDGNLDGTGWSMKKNISLGTIEAGKEKNLNVTLAVSPDMDNRYQNLLGKVKWVFTAEETEKENQQNYGNSDPDGKSDKNGQDLSDAEDGSGKDESGSGAGNGSGTGSGGSTGSGNGNNSLGTGSSVSVTGPKTGDDAPLEFLLFLCLISMTGIVIACQRKRRKKSVR